MGTRRRRRTPRAARLRRHARVAKKVRGTAARPRLTVFRSHNHIYCQLVDDDAQSTLTAASDAEADLRPAQNGGKTARADSVGARVAQRALALGVNQVVFDRGGYRYHGRVKALAEAARKGGLTF